MNQQINGDGAGAAASVTKAETELRSDQASIPAASPELSKDQQDVVNMLEKMTAMARDGKMMSVALIFSAAPGNVNLAATMACMTDLFVGASLLQDQLKAIMMQRAMKDAQAQPGGQPGQQHGRIMRVPAGFRPPVPPPGGFRP
jgi:hypothetical protein